MTLTPAKRWLDGPGAFRLVQVMAAVALLLSLAIGAKQFQMTVCQAAYNEQSNEATRVRAAAAETDRRAMDALIDDLVADPVDAGPALRTYKTARVAADQQRAAKPVPPPPSETCG